MEVTQSLWTVVGYATYKTTDTRAWAEIACPSCSTPSMLVIARREGQDAYSPDYALNAWLLCMACGAGAVVNRVSGVSPGPKKFPTPDGTPESETVLWEEIRNCLSVSAFNAVAMLCRKLLLHLVYTHERSQDPQAVPRNIKFVQAVQYLLDKGVITAAHEPLAAEIKNIGNRANHELPNITQDEAYKIAQFTHFLFISVYEMPKKANISTPFVGEAAEPYEGDLETSTTEDSSHRSDT